MDQESIALLKQFEQEVETEQEAEAEEEPEDWKKLHILIYNSSTIRFWVFNNHRVEVYVEKIK